MGFDFISVLISFADLMSGDLNIDKIL